MTDLDSGHIWRFTPVAAPDDPHWQGRRIWQVFDVVADSPGEAIAIAGREEQQMLGYDPIRDSQDFQERRSGLTDPVLYRLDRIEGSPDGLKRIMATPAESPAA